MRYARLLYLKGKRQNRSFGPVRGCKKHNLADDESALCEKLKAAALEWRKGIENKWDKEFADNYSLTS